MGVGDGYRTVDRYERCRFDGIEVQEWEGDVREGVGQCDSRERRYGESIFLGWGCA